ncbi:outer membrane protein assembly factor BamD [candidate division KSB1 bacterium]|nr:outer membrane protein assembly factor BamD [candidate division KSB1 bacterium]RQW01391.1 MAG: outer membrane protein assembly factor BamD [candidate division KSB1 bacterium]
MNTKRKYIAALMGILALFLFSCTKSHMKPNATLEERMEEGMRLFEKGNYFDAKTQFRIVTLSHSGSLIADKAQFYTAECHFNMKEYILSASEYERLIKVYPNSEYVDDAKYKLGLSYYKLSPKYSLDQEYTLSSIVHFQEFLEDYHTSDLVPEVEKYLLEARNKLAQKVYASADIYRKMTYYGAANIYYSKVLEEYYDTEFAPKALFWLGECNRRQEKYQESLDAFAEFMQKYPEHEWIPRARNKIKQTQREYEKYRRMAQGSR